MELLANGGAKLLSALGGGIAIFFNMCKANIFLLQIFNIYVNINMFLVFKYSYHFKEVYVNGKGM